jgi:hypothetical protein
MDSWDNNFEFVKQLLFPSAFPLKKNGSTCGIAWRHGGYGALHGSYGVDMDMDWMYWITSRWGCL